MKKILLILSIISVFIGSNMRAMHMNQRFRTMASASSARRNSSRAPQAHNPEIEQELTCFKGMLCCLAATGFCTLFALEVVKSQNNANQAHIK